MTTDLVRPSTPDVMTLGKVFASSGYFQDARDAAQAVVKILAGQELGFGPVASMTGMYIVKGKVSMSANLIAAAVKRGKYNYRVVELSEQACKIDFYEGKEKIGESAFSMEDAKVAGLISENYRKFARNMLFARAMSNGAKWFCADVFGGPVYTPDELGAGIDGETGEMTTRPADEVIAPPPPEPVGLIPVAPLPVSPLAEPRPGGPPAPGFAQRGTEPWVRPIEATQELEIDVADQRAILLGRITAASDKKKLTAAQKSALWKDKCGEATKDTADVAALQDLLAAVRSHA